MLVIDTILSFVVICFFIFSLLGCLSGIIWDNPIKIFPFLGYFIFILPLRYINTFIIKPIIKLLSKIYIKLFLKIKIGRIIKEIKMNKDFRGCFCDVKNEVNSWSIK